jgi:ABC-type dipeptide/oligopeptide/nickel transport system permease component
MRAGNMLKYIARRLILSVPMLLGLTIIVFAMMHLLPGDPAEVILAQSGARPDAVARLRSQLGLDQPLPVQYGRFLGGLLQGNLGSLFTNRPVSEIVAQNLPATMELAGAAMLLAIFLGMSLGIAAAVNQGSWIDHLTMTLAVLSLAMPGFWLALLLIYLFSLYLGWLPSGGQGTWQHLVLPAAVLGANSAATVARLVRSGLLEVMQLDYIVTARAKGLSERLVLLRHAVKNALVPVITVIGLQFGFLLGGTVVMETVFARQGLGRVAVEAILYKDLPVVQGIVLLVAAIYLVVNLLVDISYAFLDPRIRVQ